MTVTYHLPQPKYPLLRPTLDLVFKLLLAHPSCKSSLISLLTAVLRPSSPIVDVEVLNPGIDKDSVQERGIVMDIRVRCADGREIDVEMQAEKRRGWELRILYNWSKLLIGTIRRGNEFEDIPPCVAIFILGYEGLHRGRYHSVFHVRDSLDHDKLTAHLELHVVELPNLLKQVSPGDELLELWGRFLTATTVEQLEEVAMKNEDLAGAAERLIMLSSDEETQRLAEQRADELHFIQMGMNSERAEGRAEGRVEGLVAIRENIVQLLALRGLSVSSELKHRLDVCVNLAELRKIFERALSVSRSEELLDAFERSTTGD